MSRRLCSKAEENYLRRLYGDNYAEYLENYKRNDRERDRAPSPPPSPLASQQPQPRPAWRSLEFLAGKGLPSRIVMIIENWCFECGIDAHVVGYTKGTTGADIVYMGGQCFFCRDESGAPHTHENNHWVLIQSKGYDTARARCHASGKAAGVNLGIHF